MDRFTRRGALGLGAGLFTAGLIGRAEATIPEGTATAPNLPVEKGASLRVLRPSKFVEPDEVIFNANSKRFAELHGIGVRVDYAGWEDLRPQTAVTANTGAGPDVVVGWTDDPHLYADKLLDLSDIATYLGQKYGGWYRWRSATARSSAPTNGSRSRWARPAARRCTAEAGCTTSATTGCRPTPTSSWTSARS